MGAACSEKARAAMAMNNALGTPRIITARTPRSVAETVVGSRAVAAQAQARAEATTAAGSTRSGGAISADATGSATHSAVSDSDSAPATRSATPISSKLPIPAVVVA